MALARVIQRAQSIQGRELAGKVAAPRATDDPGAGLGLTRIGTNGSENFIES